MSNSALLEWPKISPLSSLIKAGEVALGRGDVISNIDINSFPGKYPIYSSSSKNEGRMGEYGKYMFDEELISWSVDGGGYLFYRPKHKFSVTNVSGYMRLSERWDYKFVAYCLQLQHSYLTFDYQTKAHPSVIKELYYLPEIDRSEQKAIANILDTLDTQIRQTEAIIAKLQQVKQGLLHDLLTRGIDANGQLRPPRDQAPELYKESPLGWIPREWDVCSLDSLTSKIVDGVHHTPEYVPQGVPFVTIKNMTCSDSIDFSNLKYISSKDHKEFVLRADPKAGDVLVTKDGTLGVARIVRRNMPEFSIFVSVALLRPKEGLTPEWLHLFFDSGSYLKQLAYLSSGTGLKHIHLEQFRQFLIKLPSDSEQSAINQRLNAFNGQISNENRLLEKLKKQKSGLMDDLLTGRVRVTSLLDTAKAS